jgi:HSP20 family molecular chaperone IbpA
MSLLNTLIPSRNRAVARSENSPASEAGQSVKPLYEIKENDDAWGLTVYLPGVAKDGLEITAEEGQFRIVGRRAWKKPDAWSALYREATDLPFELTLAHDNALDVDKIHAELRDGVLRVSLPKAEAIKPRKIAVS